MTESQYKRANSWIYPLIMVIFGFQEFTFVGAVLTGTGSWRVLVQLLVVAAAMIVSTFFFLTRKTKKACGVARQPNGVLPDLQNRKSLTVCGTGDRWILGDQCRISHRERRTFCIALSDGHGAVGGVRA